MLGYKFELMGYPLEFTINVFKCMNSHTVGLNNL